MKITEKKSALIKSGIFCLIVAVSLSACAAGVEKPADPTEQLTTDGDQFLKTNKPMDAIDKFSQIIDLKPTSAPAYAKRGMAELAVKQYDKALKDLDKSITLDATDPEAFYSRGLAHEGLGQFKETYEDLQKSAALYLKAGKKEDCDRVVKKLNGLGGSSKT